MDRVDIKRRAKGILSENLWTFWKGAIVPVAISLLGTLFISVVTSSGSSTNYIFTLLFGFIEAPLTIGLAFYTLGIVRGKKVNPGDIFKYLKYFMPIVVLNILILIFCMLGFFLFIIPGIILSIAFSMTTFIFADGETEPFECIRKSYDLTKGYKGDYLVFGLSFLGWALLGIFTFFILYIWLIPYMQIATAVYYEDLKKLKEPKKENPKKKIDK